MNCFHDGEHGTIVSQPNNICTVGWLSWLVKLNSEQANNLIDYLMVIGFHHRMGWRYDWLRVTHGAFHCPIRRKLRFENDRIFYLNFPERLQKYVATYFMGCRIFPHRS